MCDSPAMAFDEQPIDVWCDIDLEEIDEYECFRPETTEWAEQVNWACVLDVMRTTIADWCQTGGDLTHLLDAAIAGLDEIDRQGLESLYLWPIVASRVQITNGGHRITAMRKQGIRWALGQRYLDDVGATVDPLHAYVPVRLSEEPS